MAVDGLPLSTFKTLVRVQKANGVKLIQGSEGIKRARELVQEIGDAIRMRIASIVATSTAFSVMSDGSQARKTASEKELVLVRTVRDGCVVTLVAALQDVDEYGDATAENLKRAIDDVFQKKVPLPQDRYTTGMVCATADGASVNTGIYNGLLVRFKNAGYS